MVSFSGYSDSLSLNLLISSCLSISSVEPSLVLALRELLGPSNISPRNFIGFTHLSSIFTYPDFGSEYSIFATCINSLVSFFKQMGLFENIKPSSAYLTHLTNLYLLLNLSVAQSKVNIDRNGDVGAPCGTPFTIQSSPYSPSIPRSASLSSAFSHLMCSIYSLLISLSDSSNRRSLGNLGVLLFSLSMRSTHSSDTLWHLRTCDIQCTSRLGKNDL